LPDGRIIDDFYQIELPEYVIVFAQTPEGSIVMERHYKHGVRRIILALPAGYLEPGEEPLKGARRELLEETGYEASNWHSLGCFVVNANQGCGKAHLFIANGVRQTQHPDSGDLEEIEILLMTRGEVIQAILNGEVATLAAVATLALALNPEFVK
jgi:ADP-ribose pyrophosphatase